MIRPPRNVFNNAILFEQLEIDSFVACVYETEKNSTLQKFWIEARKIWKLRFILWNRAEKNTLNVDADSLIKTILLMFQLQIHCQ
jgi:hypothetical protein